MSCRLTETFAARRAASIVLLDKVDCSPSPPARANASATVVAHFPSSPLSRSQSFKPWIGPDASRVAHEHDVAKSEHWPSSPPAVPESSPSPVSVLVAKLRRFSGTADDVPPPPPLLPPPGGGVSREPVRGALALVAGPVSLMLVSGGSSPPKTLSQAFSNPPRSSCRCAHSRAVLRR